MSVTTRPMTTEGITPEATGQGVAASRDAVITMLDAAVTYPNGKMALSDVDVTIPRGDFVFLVGASGAGKTTFIKLLIREVQPTAGRVIVAGRDLARLRRREVPRLRRRIGIVFQDFRLLPAKTVFENVAFALEVTGAPACRAPADAALRRGAAARRHCPRAGPRPSDPHRRRADRQPRPGHQLGDHPAADPDQRAGHHGPHGDAQPGDRQRHAAAGAGARGREARAR